MGIRVLKEAWEQSLIARIALQVDASCAICNKDTRDNNELEFSSIYPEYFHSKQDMKINRLDAYLLNAGTYFCIPESICYLLLWNWLQI